MKKILLISFFIMISVLILNAQHRDNPYNFNKYSDEYDYFDEDYDYEKYPEYYYDYESVIPELDNYDSIYFYKHPKRDINFVILGDRVYIFPEHRFRSLYRRSRFRPVSMERFIHLSCFGLPYYDNYYRFSLYNDYFTRNRYSRYNRYWYRGVRKHYRKKYYKRDRKRYYKKLRTKYRGMYGERTYRKFKRIKPYKRNERYNKRYNKKYNKKRKERRDRRDRHR